MGELLPATMQAVSVAVPPMRRMPPTSTLAPLSMTVKYSKTALVLKASIAPLQPAKFIQNVLLRMVLVDAPLSATAPAVL